MDQINRELLVDLCRLVRRYSSQDWQGIIKWLEDDERRMQFVTLLRELAITSKEVASKSRRKENQPGIIHFFENLRRIDPVKASLLEEFRSKLQARNVLPTLGDLRIFADSIGFKSFSPRRREEAITQIIKHLGNLPYEEIQKALQKTLIAPRDLGKEYEQWVNLILGRSPSRADGDKPEENSS
jgi:hypothetical protein